VNLKQAKENYYANEINKEDSDNYVSELEKRNKEMLEFVIRMYNLNKYGWTLGDIAIKNDAKEIIEKIRGNKMKRF